ncbi:hypothetical protein H0H81_011093 [Sphagnurus paluster]|uniref:CFEM domain-containing protein n=1 Tax=Sphagnurus paluster TaxID=117069 RepID=A0A9P7K407_9AGAR|nr:hypothetical protein H0H81_011093 [Sphagnurus paluster]
MFSKSLLPLVFLAASVVAQSSSSGAAEPAPTDTSGISACVLTCVTTAATDNGCTSFTDLECVCTNQAFQQAAATCLQTNCTAADQAAAMALQSSQCAAVSSSVTGSATTAEGTASGTGTGAPATTPTSPTSHASSHSTSGAATGSGAGSNTVTTAPAPTKTNAALGLGENLGLAGAIVAGVVGLVL